MFQVFAKTRRLLLLTICYLLFALPARAGTAGLYLAPASGNYSVGQTFSVAVHTVTGGEQINAVAANLLYPADLLEAVSVNTNGSFITIWAEKTAAGENIRLSGGLPTPGFSGEGLVATVNFRVKAVGSASINFTEGTVVVRDSDNQNILTSKLGANFSLLTAASTPTPAPVAIAVTEPSVTPTVTSTPTGEPTPTEVIGPSATGGLIAIEEGKEGEEGARGEFSFLSFFLGFSLATLLWAGGIGIYFWKFRH